MLSRRAVLPAGRSPLAPPLALALVGGVLTAALATGGHGALRMSAQATAASSRGPLAGGPAAAATAAGGPAAAEPAPPASADRAAQVARALAVFGPAETTRARAGHASRSAHRARLHRWVRPNAGPLSSPFGYRWGRLHAGIDLAGPYGSPILAATDGCITYAGPMSGYGEVMDITDWDGTQTVYGHMSAFVRRSGCVHAGQVIARVGSGGDATGPHLHFEVHRAPGGTPVDPIRFLLHRGVSI